MALSKGDDYPLHQTAEPADPEPGVRPGFDAGVGIESSRIVEGECS